MGFTEESHTQDHHRFSVSFAGPGKIITETPQAISKETTNYETFRKKHPSNKKVSNIIRERENYLAPRCLAEARRGVSAPAAGTSSTASLERAGGVPWEFNSLGSVHSGQ